MSVAEGGPAAKAGLRQGDIISDIRDSEVDGLADFYRKVWSSGPAGAELPDAGRARRPRHLAARQVGRPQQLSQEAAAAVACGSAFSPYRLPGFMIDVRLMPPSETSVAPVVW